MKKEKTPSRETVWIIGAGRFGMIALERLSQIKKDARFVVVDPDERRFFPVENPRCAFENTDGVAFLLRRLDPADPPDWIIPALPVHLAAEWCLGRLADRGRRIPVADDLDALLPNPVRGAGGDIYVTHADFLCPDDCPEPALTCTVTEKPRKPDMFGLLEKIRFQDFQSVVIQSCQLGPGVGGYRPDQLFELLSSMEKGDGRFLVSTACRCHGVVTGIGVGQASA
ncbi:potassium transporter [Desulfococcus sp.]|uniref:potassium transporter n=1 Tax=Desulfococcus sp. TaxID=2025834 RepID=UPI0035942303